MTDQQRQQIIGDTMTHDAIERYNGQLQDLCRRVEDAVKFGGPHDAEAVRWAKERGYEVVGWRRFKKGEYFAINSDKPDSWYWIGHQSVDDAHPESTPRYILSPKEAAKVYTCEPAGTPDSQTSLVNLAWACEHNEHDRDGMKLANAIDAHMKALIQEAKQ